MSWTPWAGKVYDLAVDIIELGDRFWSKVDKSGGEDACWPWTAALYDDGYGLYKISRTQTGRAHRLVCESVHGKLGELRACHSCDNPPCCNPRHLFPGTDLENSADCVAKDRTLFGAKNVQAKLNDTLILEIVRDSGHLSKAELARRYGVTEPSIRKILNGETWSKITGINVIR